ncbi:MAG: tellurite resistance/C4-dicarboxylate transporter family protein [Conexivisphaerales archaeon]
MESVWAKVKYEVSNLMPSYFAMVMATGIVSIASFFYDMPYLAVPLMYINIAAYVIIWFFTVLRLLLFPSAYIGDLKNHRRAPGFFTVIAGNNTLAVQLVLIMHNFEAAYILWLFGLALWFVYQYSIFTSLMIGKEKPSLETGINGTWLVAVVSTESVSVLGARLSPYYPYTYTAAIIMYFIGWMMYVVLIALISYRLLFFRLDPQDATGPYWINMGATAITTLAGSLLLIYENMHLSSINQELMNQLYTFISGTTLMIWGFGSWWVPWLLIIGVWRHAFGGVKFLNYDPQFWGAVFPMGMYTVCTLMLIKATGLLQLSIIPDIFVYIAIVAWFYEISGLVYTIVKKLSTSYVPNTKSVTG